MGQDWGGRESFFQCDKCILLFGVPSKLLPTDDVRYRAKDPGVVPDELAVIGGQSNKLLDLTNIF